MLDRPIFVVGHARGGSTSLGAMINWHSQVGPRPDVIKDCDNVNDMLEKTLRARSHNDYSWLLERKDIWFDYFGGRDIYTHMGRELIVEEPSLTPDQSRELVTRLTENFHEQRFLSKAPTNSFRVMAIRKLFPDAKIVAVLRRGEQVVSSWGKLGIGFGSRIDWGTTQIEKLSYPEGIEIFSRKWCETIDYLTRVQEEAGLLIVTYDQLVEETATSLEKVLNHLELPVEDYIYDIKFDDMRAKWKRTVPLRHRWLLHRRTRRGNAVLDQIRRSSSPSRDFARTTSVAS